MQQVKTENICDQTFDELTVRQILQERDIDGSILCLCDCSCGKKNIKIVAHRLQSRKVKSCGHLLTAHRLGGQSVTLESICKCGQSFTQTFLKRDTLRQASFSKRKLCDTCNLKKRLNTRPSKHDW